MEGGPKDLGRVTKAPAGINAGSRARKSNSSGATVAVGDRRRATSIGKEERQEKEEEEVRSGYGYELASARTQYPGTKPPTRVGNCRPVLLPPEGIAANYVTALA